MATSYPQQTLLGFAFAARLIRSGLPIALPTLLMLSGCGAQAPRYQPPDLAPDESAVVWSDDSIGGFWIQGLFQSAFGGPIREAQVIAVDGEQVAESLSFSASKVRLAPGERSLEVRYKTTCSNDVATSSRSANCTLAFEAEAGQSYYLRGGDDSGKFWVHLAAADSSETVAECKGAILRPNC